MALNTISRGRSVVLNLSNLLGVLVFSLVAYPSHARDMYFAASASSNFTIDKTSFACTGDSTQSFDGTCTLAKLACSVTIQNVSTRAQVVEVAGTSLNHMIELPLAQDSIARTSFATGGFLSSTQNNAMLRQGAPIPSYRVQRGGISQYLLSSSFAEGTALSGTEPTWGGSPKTIEPGGFLVLRSVLPLQARLKYVNSGGLSRLSDTDVHPFVKSAHHCSGVLKVRDVEVSGPSAPGFVIASGSLDYIGNNADEPQRAISNPGIAADNDSELGLSIDKLETWFKANSFCSAKIWYSDPTGPVNDIWLRAIPELQVSEPHINAQVSTYCSPVVSVDYSKWISSAHPYRRSSVPIFINGGSPF